MSYKELENSAKKLPFSLACYLCSNSNKECEKTNATYTHSEKEKLCMGILGFIPKYESVYVFLNRPCNK